MNCHPGEQHCRHRRLHRMVFGVGFIVVGVLALLGNLHIVDTHRLLPYWPLIFVVLGLLHLAKRRCARALPWGGALIALGVALVLRNLGLLQLRMQDLWPLLLIFGGVCVIAKGFLPPRERHRHWREHHGLPPPVTEHGNQVLTTVIMSGSALRNDAQDFQGGELTAVMGGVELDLRQASMQSEAVLRVFALMSGVVVRVPQDWSIQIKSAPILGGLEDKTVPPMQASKRLIIEGDIIMSGIEIKN